MHMPTSGGLSGPLCPGCTRASRRRPRPIAANAASGGAAPQPTPAPAATPAATARAALSLLGSATALYTAADAAALVLFAQDHVELKSEDIVVRFLRARGSQACQALLPLGKLSAALIKSLCSAALQGALLWVTCAALLCRWCFNIPGGLSQATLQAQLPAKLALAVHLAAYVVSTYLTHGVLGFPAAAASGQVEGPTGE